MPRIPEYTAQAEQLRPSETGVEALAMAGRRAGAFYDQAANAQRQGAQDVARSAMAIAGAKESEARAFGGAARSFGELGAQAEQSYAHHEIADGAAAFATLHSDLTDQWNAQANSADPRDTSIAPQFRETTLEPALEKFRQAFNTEQGQQWAEGHIAALREHMVEKQNADMSTRAGDAVAINVRRTTNAWTNTAYNDPSSVPFLLSTADAQIADIVSTSPNLKGADAARARTKLTEDAREAIVRAGAHGAIERSGDPEAAAAAFAKRYPELINGAEADQFAKAAKTQQRTNLIQQKQIEVLQRQQEEQAVHRESASIMANRVSIDPTTGRPTIDPKFFEDALSIARRFPNAPNAAETARTLINWGEAKQKGAEATVDDPTVKGMITSMITNPGVQLNDVRIATWKAETNGQITPRTRQSIIGTIQALEEGPIHEPIYQKTMADAARMIGLDQGGKDRFADFQLAFLNQYLSAKRSEGGTQPDALDLNNPDSMIRKAMKPYERTPQQRLADKMAHGERVAPGDIPPKSGIVPPEAQRVIGAIYDTPKGKARWTESGWEMVK